VIPQAPLCFLPSSSYYYYLPRRSSPYTYSSQPGKGKKWAIRQSALSEDVANKYSGAQLTFLSL
jgi:hypothetical protein